MANRCSAVKRCTNRRFTPLVPGRWFCSMAKRVVRPARRLGSIGAGLLAHSTPCIGRERILRRLAADAEIFLVRLDGTRALHALPGASLIIVNGWEVAIGGQVQKQCKGLAAAFEATVEFGIGLGEG